MKMGAVSFCVYFGFHGILSAELLVEQAAEG
jgi:hypothetical protein